MRPRFDAARELANQTTKRCLERLAGLGAERLSPWSDEFDLVVANPSPRLRSDLVRFALDFHPYVVPDPDVAKAIHPTVLGDLGTMGFTVDGVPARRVPAETGRMKLLPDRGAFDLEFVARDVPALGFRRVHMRRAPDAREASDLVELVEAGSPEAAIAAPGVRVRVQSDGRFDLVLGERSFPGQGALESSGDRGDSYDYDEVREGPGLRLESVSVERRRHTSGIQELRVVRQLSMPARLASSRDARSAELAPLEVETRLRVVPGVARVDLELRVENCATDHRLRMHFPVGGDVSRFEAATTFDVAERAPGPRDDEGWVQAAPATFPHQGFVHAGGLTVVAPGLPEAELLRGQPASIAITLLRCVGSLSRHDLRSRPGPAGPGTDTPGAQCPGQLRAKLSLLAGLDPGAAREAELGLKAVVCGEQTLAPEGLALLQLEPPALLLSTLKPAEQGEGIILRVLNPTASDLEARVTLGFPFQRARAVRLDEELASDPLERQGPVLRFPIPAHALRTLRID